MLFNKVSMSEQKSGLKPIVCGTSTIVLSLSEAELEPPGRKSGLASFSTSPVKQTGRKGGGISSLDPIGAWA